MTRLRNRRISLHNKNPYCFWCGVKTEIKQPRRNQFNDNAATIDHLDSHWKSLKHIKTEDGSRTVLSCKKCNANRNKKEQRRSKPFYKRIYRKIRKFYKDTFIYKK